MIAKVATLSPSQENKLNSIDQTWQREFLGELRSKNRIATFFKREWLFTYETFSLLCSLF